jgi:HD-GYP domain-containing protein (c-di-GMP phosphodiesterase class II)
MDKNNPRWDENKYQQELSFEELHKLFETLPGSIKSYIRFLESQIKNLTDIGLALSREKDIKRLLEMILLEAKRISHSDGGTIYMMTDDKRLRFEIIISESLNFHMGGTSGKEVSFQPLNLYTEDGRPNKSMVAVYVALTGETVNIPDAYEAEGFDFSGTKSFDKDTGYRSKSFLTVPLKNHEDDIIGVLQLLNAKDDRTGTIIPFSREVQEVVEALSSQAAVAITNTNLINDLSKLFESFIKLIASAIDEKSPYTGGHCERVPVLTMMLAEAVSSSKDSTFADLHFTEKDMYELKIAAWLHDCGKVTTPEYVVDKATKLETIYDRIHEIETRAEVMKRGEQIKYLKKKIKNLKDRSLSAAHSSKAEAKLSRAYRAKISQIENDLKFLREANIGGEFMSDDKKERVLQIAQYMWKADGERKPFLTEDEVKNLSISRGTLNDEERKVINDHIVLTIKMLSQLPYPKHLRNVPEYAGGHHETLIGTGYPKGLKKDEMSVQARILAVADIFEALTASDRPYKKPKSLSETMKILEFMRKDGHIDPDILDIFIKEKIYLKYATEFLKPEQIDDVRL